jgi:hypothetical protein
MITLPLAGSRAGQAGSPVSAPAATPASGYDNPEGVQRFSLAVRRLGVPRVSRELAFYLLHPRGGDDSAAPNAKNVPPSRIEALRTRPSIATQVRWQCAIHDFVHNFAKRHPLYRRYTTPGWGPLDGVHPLWLRDPAYKRAAAARAKTDARNQALGLASAEEWMFGRVIYMKTAQNPMVGGWVEKAKACRALPASEAPLRHALAWGEKLRIAASGNAATDAAIATAVADLRRQFPTLPLDEASFPAPAGTANVVILHDLARAPRLAAGAASAAVASCRQDAACAAAFDIPPASDAGTRRVRPAIMGPGFFLSAPFSKGRGGFTVLTADTSGTISSAFCFARYGPVEAPARACVVAALGWVEMPDDNYDVNFTKESAETLAQAQREGSGSIAGRGTRRGLLLTPAAARRRR